MCWQVSHLLLVLLIVSTQQEQPKGAGKFCFFSLPYSNEGFAGFIAGQDWVISKFIFFIHSSHEFILSWSCVIEAFFLLCLGFL